MLSYKNKSRFYLLILNIFNNILQYKQIGLSNIFFSKYLNNISLNFNVISDKNLYFFYCILDILFLFKTFSKKIIVKKLLLGNLKLFFENVLNKNIFFLTFESILKNENIYLFLNYIFKLYFLKYNLKINKKKTSTINFISLKFLNLVFFNLFGKFKINFFLDKKISKKNEQLYITNLINFFYNFYKI